MTSTSLVSFSAETASLVRNNRYHFVVTGATGWIGRTTTEMLSSALGSSFESHVSCFGSGSRKMVLQNGKAKNVEPLSMLDKLEVKAPTIILHYAFLTKDKVSGLSSEEYKKRNRDITKHVVRFARRVKAVGIMVASSGAVYDYLNISKRENEALLYGQLKYEDEEQFCSLGSELDIPVIVPRIFNISGPYINKYRAYALSSIIDDIIRNGRIELTANVPVYRAYISVVDVVEVCMHWLLAQKEAVQCVLDAAGEEVVEVGELASRSGRLLGKPDIKIYRPDLSTGKENRYVGDGRPFRALARHYGRKLQGLDAQILATSAYIGANPQ